MYNNNYCKGWWLLVQQCKCDTQATTITYRHIKFGKHGSRWHWFAYVNWRVFLSPFLVCIFNEERRCPNTWPFFSSCCSMVSRMKHVRNSHANKWNGILEFCLTGTLMCLTINIYNYLQLPFFQESDWWRHFLSKYTLTPLSIACPSCTTWMHWAVFWCDLSNVPNPFLDDQPSLKCFAKLTSWKRSILFIKRFQLIKQKHLLFCTLLYWDWNITNREVILCNQKQNFSFKMVNNMSEERFVYCHFA